MIFSSVLCVRCSLILFCGCTEPDCGGCAQDEFNDCGVELAHHLLWQTVLHYLLWKVHPLLGLFKDEVYVGLPLQVLRYGSSQELEALHG